MWTQFHDMHSGGGSKEPYERIYIEAPADEARVIFYNRFGHNPEHVSCTCCGDDYSISEDASLKQLTGFDRGCRCLVTPKDAQGRYMNSDPVLRANYYLDDGEEPPVGYRVDETFSRYRPFQTLEDYLKRADVLVIYAADIKPEERVGTVPTQGYVW